MKAAFARTAAPMLRLFQMVGLTPRHIGALSPGQRQDVARRVRREANLYGIPRFRATHSPYVIGRRRARNYVARRSRRINRLNAR
jgi:hypothetical protein